jgi:2-oxoglutarate dehydrogenase E2 component (dihydrolipoamide succinyltransferase)
MTTTLNVPELGESITSAFIAKWLKQVGESVAKGESMVELDSDKASLEVPSPAAGVVEELLVKEGDEVAIGAAIARIGEGTGAAAGNGKPADTEAPPGKKPTPSTTVAETKTPPSKKAAPETVAAPAAKKAAPAKPDHVAKAGPAVRQAAAQKGVDLSLIEGSGHRGQILEKDLESVGHDSAVREAPASDDRVERVPMSPLRRTIARRLVQVNQEAAMLTTFNEVDMSAVKALREKYQPQFQERYGIKLGFMSFFVKASIEALKAFPAVNAEIQGDELLYKHYFNIGVAVSGPKGLVVPVVKDAESLSFAETEQAIAELAKKARDNKLEPADFQDGTFTITNGGVFGSMLSTPILNPPQAGILGMHNIVERPVGVEGRIELRPIMYVALTYDHRIIDGREAVSFLVRVKELVEHPERILLEV